MVEKEFVFTLNNINYENAANTNERIRGGIQNTLKDYDNIRNWFNMQHGYGLC